MHHATYKLRQVKPPTSKGDISRQQDLGEGAFITTINVESLVNPLYH